MTLETVSIGGDQYFIHQLHNSYAVDTIGNPHYLGEDYLQECVEVIPPRVNGEGNIYYTHNDMDSLEDEFIAYCRVELKTDSLPIAVCHENGDKFDCTPENLRFVYDREML